MKQGIEDGYESLSASSTDTNLTNFGSDRSNGRRAGLADSVVHIGGRLNSRGGAHRVGCRYSSAGRAADL